MTHLELTPYEFLRLDNETTGEKYGVEVEVEFRKRVPDLTQLSNQKWTLVRDGSLRGEGYEFVQRQPRPLKQTLLDIDHLYDVIGETKINVNQRAGTHVHVNFSDVPLSGLFRFVEYWYLLEPLLVRFGGRSRVGNHFCLRAVDAEDILVMINSFMDDGRYLFNDDYRYAALNWCSLGRYGTLETRCCGTYGSQHLKDFVSILSELRTQALENYQPAYPLYSGHTEVEMVQALLPTHWEKLTQFLTEEDTLEDFHRNIRMMQCVFLIT